MPTIAEQLTQLASDRDDLVSNLTTKGITGLTGDETFTELVPEVLNIPSGGGTPLPIAFQQVEYIRSTGTQYIRLDYTPNANTEITFDFKDDNITAWENYFGTDSNGIKFQRRETQSSFFMGSGKTDANFDYSPSTRSTLIFNMSGVYDGDRNLIVQSAATYISTSKKMLVFLGYNGNSLDVKSSYYLYDYKISENSIEKIHLIPCYRKSDNVIGLYDIVNYVFYTNTGSGTFIKGPDV